MTTAAVLTAAGSGTRLGLDLPKALVPLGGVPLVVHAARGLVASGVVDQLIVTAPVDHVDAVHDLVADVVTDGVALAVVPGGASRQASVAAGLAVLAPDVDVVLVHDAARALTPPDLVARVVDAVRAGHPAVIPGLTVTDTITRVAAAAGAPEDGVAAAGTLDRAELRAVQTPQGFDRAVLDRAHAAGAHRSSAEDTAATDDASLVEGLGLPVWVVAGHEDAAKITTPRDLAVAETVLARRGTPVAAPVGRAT